jgi:lipoprotein NlpD
MTIFGFFPSTTRFTPALSPTSFSGFAPVRLLAACLIVSALVGCASSSRFRAPVEERGNAAAAATAAKSAASPPDATKPPPPGIENAGKPGYYTIKQGDTLIRVGLETGQNWRDIQKWNNLDNPNVIEAGQVLRVVAPGIDPTAASAKPVTSAKVEGRPLDVKASAGAASAPTASSVPPSVAGAASASSQAGTPAAASAGPAAGSSAGAAAREGEDDVSWSWPAQGALISGFDETRNKGIEIAGKAGDAVMAASDGRVVYAGSGLRGYGNLVIIKHNDTFLTAYAHNQTLLVKEDQPVRRGQKIAEMGQTDAERVQLHFEIRRRGKPIDPTKLLPSR